MKSDNPISQNIRLIFRALRHRNFRLFFLGQSVSLVGTWMQTMAIGWLVYRITHSALMLGVVGFASQISSFILSPLAGVYADRWNRHRVLMITQSLAMLQALTLAILVMRGHIAVWHLVCLSTFLGIVFAFDAPIRQSFIVEMIDSREDLGNAIALNSMMFNAARLIVPSIAGIVVAMLGEGLCFVLNGVSYSAVIVSLMAMKFTARKTIVSDTHVIEDLKEGFSYALRFPPIKSIVLLIGLVSLMGMPYAVLMPVFAHDILHGAARTLGFLMGAAGMGALAGAAYLASRKSVRGLGNIIALNATLLGIGLIAFSFSRALWISLSLMVVVGFGAMVQMGASNIVLQTIVDDDKRGRVMSFYTMAFLGMAPFGSLLAGTLANKIGAPLTFVISGTACIAGALIFSRTLSALRETTQHSGPAWASFMH